MAKTVYETSDGQKHDSIGSGLAHQSILDLQKANLNSQFNSGSSYGGVTSGINDSAQIKFDAGDYDGAIKAANEVFVLAKGETRSARTFNIIAKSYSKKGDNKNAIDYYTCTLRLLQKSNEEARPSVYNDRGLAYKAIGDIDNAIKDLKLSADYGFNGALTNLKNMGIIYSSVNRSNEDFYTWQKTFDEQYKNVIRRIIYEWDEDDFETSSNSYKSSSGKKVLITIGIVLAGIYIIYQILSFLGIIRF